MKRVIWSVAVVLGAMTVGGCPLTGMDGDAAGDMQQFDRFVVDLIGGDSETAEPVAIEEFTFKFSEDAGAFDEVLSSQ